MTQSRKGHFMAMRSTTGGTSSVACAVPDAEILAALARLDLPADRKAEAIAAYLKACGWRAPAPPANKRLPSPEPQDMS